MNLKNMGVMQKLIGSVLLGMIVAISVLTILSYTRSKDALYEQTINQLVTVKEVKGRQIENFFTERIGDVQVLADNPYTKEALYNFGKVDDVARSKGLYGKRLFEDKQFKEDYEKVFPTFEYYMKTYGYYDIFLIHGDGEVMFTVTLEPDFGTDLKEENTDLVSAWKEVMRSGEAVLTDMAPYAPSNNVPAQFVAAPIRVDGEIIGVVALQISLEAINDIMQERSGMGETGESYLVGMDKRMRSDSFLDPKGHSVEASMAGSVKNNGIDTDASRDALAGSDTEKIVDDYNGNPVFSAYHLLTLHSGIQWALLVEKDVAEVDIPINKLRNTIIFIAMIILLLIAGMMYYIVKSILKPVGFLQEGMEAVGNNNLDTQIQVLSNDELGKLSQWFNEFVLKLKDIKAKEKNVQENVQSGTSSLNAASSELSDISNELSDKSNNISDQANSVAVATEQMATNLTTISSAAEEAQINLNTVASATEEMTTTVNEIAGNTEKARTITMEAMDSVSNATEKVDELGTAAQEISKVTATIMEIAEQTKLLALNATIEAARAGEAGKGFAVVANEVKELAKQSNDATEDISIKILAIQNSTDSTVEEIKKISDIVGNVTEIVMTIATAVEEQNTTSREIATNISQATIGVADVVKNVVEVADVSKEVAANIANVNNEITDIRQTSSNLNNNVLSLKDTSGQLKDMADQFVA